MFDKQFLEPCLIFPIVLNDLILCAMKILSDFFAI